MHTFVWFVQGLFLVGVAGCAITIPLCAWKFVSVLFEPPDESEVAESSAAADD